MNWPLTALAGAGKMGSAMIGRWLEAGMPPSSLHVSQRTVSDALRASAYGKGFHLNPTNFPNPDVLVIAIKPQQLEEEAFAVFTSPPKLVVSILAGKTCSALKTFFPNARIIRAMPNIAVEIGASLTGLFMEDGVTEEDVRKIEKLFSPLGETFRLANEDLMDAFSSISGSGPAYFFYFAECLAQAAMGMGFGSSDAARLSRLAAEAAGLMLRKKTDASLSDLRESVTSAGGITAAALDVFAQAGLEDCVRKAVYAAKDRAGTLAR